MNDKNKSSWKLHENMVLLLFIFHVFQFQQPSCTVPTSTDLFRQDHSFSIEKFGVKPFFLVTNLVLNSSPLLIIIFLFPNYLSFSSHFTFFCCFVFVKHEILHSCISLREHGTCYFSQTRSLLIQCSKYTDMLLSSIP